MSNLTDAQNHALSQMRSLTEATPTGQWVFDAQQAMKAALKEFGPPSVNDVLLSPRVRWKFNHDTEWRYGRPIAYTDQPSFIIEREKDGVRVGVLASFNPEPAP